MKVKNSYGLSCWNSSYLQQGRNSVSKAGGRRQPISQDLEAGGCNIFVRMDLSLKYSQKRNFFHFFEQKKTKFSKAGGWRAPLPVFTPLIFNVSLIQRRFILKRSYWLFINTRWWWMTLCTFMMTGSNEFHGLAFAFFLVKNLPFTH